MIIIVDCDNINSSKHSVFAKNIQDSLEEESIIIPLSLFLEKVNYDNDIIISGCWYQISQHKSLNNKLIDFLRKRFKLNNNLKTIGICHGAQIIALAIDKNSISSFDKINMNVKKIDLSFFNINNTNVLYMHRDYINSKNPKIRVILEDKFEDKKFTEIFYHKENKNIIGIQFHPEVNNFNIESMISEYKLPKIHNVNKIHKFF